MFSSRNRSGWLKSSSHPNLLCLILWGSELQVINKTEKVITLKADGLVTLTPSQDQEASSEVLPINFNGLAKVDEVKGDDVICILRNAATLAGSLFTLHASQVHIDLLTLTEKDKE
ncbi:unnamed protein product, partial [Cochlearia groenlandica]